MFNGPWQDLNLTQKKVGSHGVMGGNQENGYFSVFVFQYKQGVKGAIPGPKKVQVRGAVADMENVHKEAVRIADELNQDKYQGLEFVRVFMEELYSNLSPYRRGY